MLADVQEVTLILEDNLDPWIAVTDSTIYFKIVGRVCLVSTQHLRMFCKLLRCCLKARRAEINGPQADKCGVVNLVAYLRREIEKWRPLSLTVTRGSHCAAAQ